MGFNARALYAAVDAQRAARNMTWSDVSEALGVSVATLRELPDQKLFETDGVLQMTRWLGLNIESFVGRGGEAGHGPDPGDFRSTGRMLRFDCKALFEAVDAARKAKEMTWQKVAEEIAYSRVTAISLMNLKKASRIELTSMLAIIQWLGVRSSRFTRLTTT